MTEAAGCQAFEDDLSALLDGELGAARAAEVEAHVARCAACARRLR
ncbi:MAG: anti-sigma factor, partial [Proteobacteria bacterium]